MASSSAWPCPSGVSAWAPGAGLEGRLNLCLRAWLDEAHESAGPEFWALVPTWARTRKDAQFSGKWCALPLVSQIWWGPRGPRLAAQRRAGRLC